MDMSMAQTSWWTNPALQFDYSRFAAARDAELPRMQTDKSAAAKVDALVTHMWSVGFPGKRRGSPGRVVSL